LVTRDAPLLVWPRLDPKPWGGKRLARFGFVLPAGSEPLGEALLTHGDATVADPVDDEGPTLTELVEAAPEDWVGALGAAVTGDRPCFPLLAKFIDAAADLSIQLHPDDRAARAIGEPVGKTEAWHVLAAEPGARLYLGLRPGVTRETFVAALRAGGDGTVDLLRPIPAEAGMTLLLPAGTVHALGGGVLVYEIQQPSTVTYRLHDWGRLDNRGRSRELHLEAGLAVLKPDLRPEPIAPVMLPSAGGRRELLVATRLFALERIALQVGEPLILPAEESPQVVTCLGGIVRMDGRGGGVILQAGETAVAPVGLPLRLSATLPAVTVRAWVPDLGRDIVRPARAAGAPDTAIAALAGSLPDLRAFLSQTAARGDRADR
jgi:mannose-6-phosphate isomerase